MLRKLRLRQMNRMNQEYLDKLGTDVMRISNSSWCLKESLQVLLKWQLNVFGIS